MKLATLKRHATMAVMLQYCEGEQCLTLSEILEQVTLLHKIRATPSRSTAKTNHLKNGNRTAGPEMPSIQSSGLL